LGYGVRNETIYVSPQIGGNGVVLDYYNGSRIVQLNIAQQYSVAVKHLFVFSVTGKLYVSVRLRLEQHQGSLSSNFQKDGQSFRWTGYPFRGRRLRIARG
jgi:hypothetical protein